MNCKFVFLHDKIEFFEKVTFTNIIAMLLHMLSNIGLRASTKILNLFKNTISNFQLDDIYDIIDVLMS